MAYLQFPYQALGTRPPDPTLAHAPGRGRTAPDSLPGTITGGRHLRLDRCSSDRRQEGLLGALRLAVLTDEFCYTYNQLMRLR